MYPYATHPFTPAVITSDPFTPPASSPSSIPRPPASGVNLRRKEVPSPWDLPGARPALTVFTPPCAPARLRASQVRSVAAQELAWFGTSTKRDAASVAARAQIACWLEELTPAEREVLELGHNSEPWPRWLREDPANSFALVRGMVSTRRKPRVRTPYVEECEQRETEQLERAALRYGARVLHGVEKRADRDFASAVRAYARARGRVLSVLPEGGSR